MPCKINKGRLFLAIQATKPPHNLSIRRAAHTYKVLETTLRDRLYRAQPQADRRNLSCLLTKAKEEEVIQHIVDLDV